MTRRTPHRDAIRILFAVQAGATQSSDNSLPDVISTFKGKTRLLAFDFWIRNPDYLAAELLDIYEQTHESSYLGVAESIISDNEPDLRRVPMIRFMFGAFDRLDDALSLLRSRDLIRISTNKIGNSVIETDFLLTSLGRDACEFSLAQAPVLRWYADRANLVAKVAGDRSGNSLKQKQYERAQYAETKLGGVIPPISEEVFQRLQALRTTK
jgi:hypothetical protein